MRSAVLLLVLVMCGPLRVLAACPPDGVWLFPAPGSVVPTNSRFVLEGLGAFGPRVARLPGRVLRLRTSGHEVRVSILRGWTSALGRSAVILKPEGPLKPGLEYTLQLDGVLPDARVVNTRGSAAPAWRSGRGPDQTKPQWQQPPSVSEGLFHRTPEGTERFAKVRMSLIEESPAYAVVTLSRQGSTGAAQRYFTPLQDGVVLVGHDACGGGFSLEGSKSEGSKSFRAQFEVFDTAGNAAPAVPPIQFEAPVTRESP